MEEVNKKYKKILNDLLNITKNDSCIFSNVNNKTIFDVQKKFSDSLFNKIISEKDFNLPLTQINNEYFINQILKCNSIEELISLYKAFNEEIPDELNNLLKKNDVSIEKVKHELIKSMEINRQKFSFEWKLIVNKARALNEQNNLWPIHLGFIYITLRIDNKVIQAPMFFKEVNIKINNSMVSIVSIGDIKINEKLIYFLESNNFLLNVDADYSKMSIKELFEVIKNSWSQNFKIPETLKGFVPNFKESEINNNTVMIWPGVSLGFFEPTGGYLRKLMLKILNEGHLDDILEVEFDKNIYKKTITDSIFKKNFGFYKIVHSNLSQDKAIVSALNQNTIIWGPPGTGKSQTITNILTNVLMFNKTALVVSQKKAALEVLKNRMESLEIFCLFILNDREMNKKKFYELIKSYISFLENFDLNAEERMIKIISDKEKELMKLTNSIMKNELAEENIVLFSEFDQSNGYNKESLNDLMMLDHNIKFNIEELKNFKNKNKMVKYVIKHNDLQKNKSQYSSKNIKRQINIITNNFIDKSIDLDHFLTNKDKINQELWAKLNLLKNNNNRKNKSWINDHNNLKIVIAKKIIEKIKNFDLSLKAKYNEFALDVRAASLDPAVFIKKHAAIIKIIYPIIITTPETDLQSWTKGEFDYALLDESSQIYLEKGLPILYLAKIKILAGDDQQMQPSKWFASKLDNEENPFGQIESLLDYAVAKGVYALLLDKNYRSSFASLMTFNSQIFYKGELDVVDTWKENNDSLPIEVINVNGAWENSKNDQEIDEVIKQTLFNINKFKKIIILAFNASQQLAIETKIIESHPELEQAINTQKILIRNIENIQGDEADLLIASIAYDKNTKLHATYVAKPGGKNALNVATSRAKDKMIVIKSINSEDIINNSSEDILIFKEWLKFLDMNEEERKNYKYYKNELAENEENERLINKTNVGIKIDNLTNILIQTIQADLEKDIVDFNSKFDFVINYSIGTLQIPVAIINKSTKQFVVGIFLDTYKYWRSYDEYVLDKDIENFFIIKKYPIQRISLLNWNIKKELIFKRILDYLEKHKTDILRKIPEKINIPQNI
ncbi:AAA domain-containing protein [Metamycoplasma sualvi]|uniref:AAA domain-containing protein n=1 Tax=Metamycoplasma sualvi TaxID=2125 RepID=UPI003872D07E